MAKWAYLLLFSVLRMSIYLSAGQVSSKRWMVCLWLSMITMSGFCEVTHSSGGIEPPPGAVCPGKSLYTVYFSSIEFAMKLITQLCLQVKRPLSSPILHILKTWSDVCLPLQSLHRSETGFFHRLRFAAVGRVSLPALRRNLRVPCFRSYMKLFQTRSCFSAAARARLCPCTVRLLTCSSHFCLLSTLSALFTEVPTSVWNLCFSLAACAPVKVGISPITVFDSRAVLKTVSASIHVFFLRVYSDSLCIVASITLLTMGSPFNLVLLWLTVRTSFYSSEMAFTSDPSGMCMSALVALGGSPAQLLIALSVMDHHNFSERFWSKWWEVPIWTGRISLQDDFSLGWLILLAALQVFLFGHIKLQPHHHQVMSNKLASSKLR